MIRRSGLRMAATSLFASVETECRAYIREPLAAQPRMRPWIKVHRPNSPWIGPGMAATSSKRRSLVSPPGMTPGCYLYSATASRFSLSVLMVSWSSRKREMRWPLIETGFKIPEGERIAAPAAWTELPCHTLYELVPVSADVFLAAVTRSETEPRHDLPGPRR
jgi:hypothetical protein